MTHTLDRNTKNAEIGKHRKKRMDRLGLRLHSALETNFF